MTASVQRRTLTVLAVGQALAGIGVGAGVAVGPLIASELSGSDAIAGLTQTSAVVGAALAALPLARVAQRRGRRTSISTGFAVAALGAVAAWIATTAGSWQGLVGAMILFGFGSATGLAARFAATDLSTLDRRATDLSIVVWATTIGSVLGPTLAGVADDASHAGTDTHSDAGHTMTSEAGMAADAVAAHAGPTPMPYILSAAAFALAALVVWLFLRPDPLHVAAAARAATGGAPQPAGIRAGWAAVRRSRAAQLALGTIAVSHLTMVGLMSMTPVHMNHGNATLKIVGIVISIHIAGMYAFSPLVGWLADRIGPLRVLVIGAVLLLTSAVIAAGATSQASTRLAIGMFLLGLGWSCALVGGSALLVTATGSGARTAVQGVSDLTMNLGGALGGIVAGVVIANSTYAALSWGAAVMLVPYLVIVLMVAVRKVPPPRR